MTLLSVCISPLLESEVIETALLVERDREWSVVVVAHHEGATSSVMGWRSRIAVGQVMAAVVQRPLSAI